MEWESDTALLLSKAFENSILGTGQKLAGGGGEGGGDFKSKDEKKRDPPS